VTAPDQILIYKPSDIGRDHVNTLPVPVARFPVQHAPDVADLVAAFLAGRNARTVKAYGQDLETFRTWLGAAELEDAAQHLLAGGLGAANAIALAFRAHLSDRDLAPATVNRHLAALRSLVKLARTLGLVGWTLEVPSVKAEPYRDTRGPGVGGVRGLLSILDARRDAKGRRDRALVRLLYDLALRRAEAVALDVADVDLAAGTVQVLGKGRTERTALSLPGPTCEALRDWLAVRGPAAGPLFVNFDRAGKGQRLTGASVYRLIRRLGATIGLTVRPHGLRHAAITEALELTGGDLRRVQRFSPHRDVRTISRYDDNRLDLGGEVARQVAGTV